MPSALSRTKACLATLFGGWPSLFTQCNGPAALLQPQLLTAWHKLWLKGTYAKGYLCPNVSLLPIAGRLWTWLEEGYGFLA